MAGIGFQLRQLTVEGTFIGDVKAYAYAGIISAGPWLISVMCLAFLWVFSYPALDLGLQKLFRVAVIYSFAYSLITTGIIQLVVTRFLADRLYLKQKNILLPTYTALILLTVLIQGASAAIFYAFSNVSLSFKIVGVMLYIAVSCIWQSMIFLSASRDYMAIVKAFFIGAVISFFGALLFGHYYGITGHLFGFTIGQIVTVFLFMYRIFYEFDSTVVCRFDFVRQIPHYTDLLLVGTFYYMAIWVDKIIYWYSPAGEHITALFYSQYPYDSCVFIAFLTIIPALAHFLVDVETNFYEAYKDFYGTIINKGSYQTIMIKKKQLTETLTQTCSRIFVMQTVVTTLFLFLAPHFVQLMSLNKREHLWTVWAAGVGAYFHSFLLIIFIIILYFNRRREALWLSLFFLVSNFVTSFIVMYFFPKYMGVGYAVATFLSCLVALLILLWDIANIEYLTFVEQPLSKPSLPKKRGLAVNRV